MKKFLIAAVAVATLTGAAGAASAQSYGGGYGYGAPRGGQIQSVDRRQDELSARIEQGARSGRLTPNEVQNLRSDIRSIDRLERQYRRDRGLNRQEVNNLFARLDNIEQRLNRDLRDGQRYGQGYGDRYDRDNRYDRR